MVQGCAQRRYDRSTHPPDDQFVMDFGILVIPPSQIGPYTDFVRGSFALLFQTAQAPHPPRSFTRATAGNDQRQTKFNKIVHNNGGLDLEWIAHWLAGLFFRSCNAERGFVRRRILHEKLAFLQ
jgi:hypothetical protein